MDCDEAVRLHSEWKNKLRQCLAKKDHGLRPADVSLDHKCALGQWIYGEGATYSSLPEYAKLKDEHARFHIIAAELVRRANAGESLDAEIAPCSSTQFSTSSSIIVIAIMAMKKRLSG